MKKFLSERLTQLRWRLILSYALLNGVAMVGHMLGNTFIYDYFLFQRATTAAHVTEVVRSERAHVVQSLASGQQDWSRSAVAHLQEKLTTLEDSGDAWNLHRITSSSRPVVYVSVVPLAVSSRLIAPQEIPAPVAAQLRQAATDVTLARPVTGTDQRKGEPTVLAETLSDVDGRPLGTLAVYFHAKFDPGLEWSTDVRWVAHAWLIILSASLIIGTLCGTVAASYVTKRLAGMNKVIASWRGGNFTPRMVLPSEDELTTHSQNLNAMADELHGYMQLQRHVAIGEERNRVARDLHDTVKQKLFALKLQIATVRVQAERDKAQLILDEADAIIGEAQRDIAGIIDNLHPAGNSGAGLSGELTSILHDTERRFGIAFQAQLDSSIVVPATSELHLIRVVQEAIGNVVRHSQARKLTVRLARDGNRVALCVMDNGIGFDALRRGTGLGLTSMRERATELRAGSFEVRSEPGIGTTVRIEWQDGDVAHV